MTFTRFLRQVGRNVTVDLRQCQTQERFQHLDGWGQGQVERFTVEVVRHIDCDVVGAWVVVGVRGGRPARSKVNFVIKVKQSL